LPDKRQEQERIAQLENALKSGVYDRDPTGGKTKALTIVFGVVAASITILLQFEESRANPPILPDEFRPYANSPLNTKLWCSEPRVAINLFFHRLRCGQYKSTIFNNVSFSAAEYLGYNNDGTKSTEPWRWWTWGTHMVGHYSIIHLGMSIMVFNNVCSALVPMYGAARTMAIFILGGAGGAAAYCGIQSWLNGERLKSGDAVRVTRMEKTTRDENGVIRTMRYLQQEYAPGMRDMFVRNLGASGGLMSLFTVTAIAMPQIKWGLPFLPFSFGTRSMLAGVMAFDLVGLSGFLGNTGIAHAGHLLGDVAGALLYLLWLRRLPVSRFLKQQRKAM
jgi:membrane associated rhomboid family serine protease